MLRKQGNHIPGIFITALILLYCVTKTETHWWSLANGPLVEKLSSGSGPVCDHVRGMSRNQNLLCQKYHDHMKYVSEGARSGIDECQWQFRDHRWNCSVREDSTVFGKVLNIGSKETAFSYAISAAGVVHSVARACKTQKIKACGCSKARRPAKLHKDWNWGGCGDDTEYAYGFAREFIDARERDNLSPRGKARLRKAMNMHNNEAGRLTVVRSARPTCKCHGASGSCSLKTCWMQVPTFRDIGDKLRDEHKNAKEVRLGKRGQLRPRKSRKTQPTITNLVYIESSPDYCKRNSRTGVPGTRGRRCNEDSTGMDGCGLLCCGRGYKSKSIEVVERCNCKFQWCCVVRCQKCKKTIERHICN